MNGINNFTYFFTHQKNKYMEKTLSTTQPYTDKVFTINRSEIDFGNGKIWTFEYISSSANSWEGVIIVALDQENNVFLIEQFQVAANKRLLTLPKWWLENWISIEQQVHSELQEETWYKANKITRLTELEIFPGRHQAKSYLYLAQDLEASPKQGDELEDMIVHKIPFAECIAKIMSWEIVDSRTIAWLLFVKEYLKM